MENKKYTITKKIAKHGSQAIIVVPRILEEQLKPGIIAQITIEILNNELKGGNK
jgi:antitoxin component of MazEF toxin-antitoxin module